MAILEIVKADLPNTALTDAQINNRIEEVGQLIKDYCNRNDIPKELNFVHANMVIDLISFKERASLEDGNLITKSITEGDTQVTLESRQANPSERSTQNILFDYTSQLNKYRKLRW